MKKLEFILIFWLVSVTPTFAQIKYEKLDNKPINQSDLKSLTAACQLGKTITKISLNNVSTWVHMDGILWSDPDIDWSGYEIPKGSRKTSLAAGGIWIGGTDVNGQLKLPGVKYKGARNYWPWPLIMVGERRGTTDIEVCYQYDRHFEITRYMVEAFREWSGADPVDRQRGEI